MTAPAKKHCEQCCQIELIFEEQCTCKGCECAAPATLEEAAVELMFRLLENPPVDRHATILAAFEDVARQAAADEREKAAGIMDGWFAAYPLDIFPEPPPGEHGETVDACSARMGRHVAERAAEQIRANEEKGA